MDSTLLKQAAAILQEVTDMQRMFPTLTSLESAIDICTNIYQKNIEYKKKVRELSEISGGKTFGVSEALTRSKHIRSDVAELIVRASTVISEVDQQIFWQEFTNMRELVNYPDWFHCQEDIPPSVRSRLSQGTIDFIEIWRNGPHNYNCWMLFKELKNIKEVSPTNMMQTALTDAIASYEGNIASATKSLDDAIKAVHCDVQRESSIKEGIQMLDQIAAQFEELKDFSFFNDLASISCLTSMASAIDAQQDKAGAMRWFAEDGKLFSDNPILSILSSHPAVDKCGRSGCSMGWTLAQFRYIAQNGWTEYVKLIFVNRGIGWSALTLDDATKYNCEKLRDYIIKNATKYNCEKLCDYIIKNDSKKIQYLLDYNKDDSKKIQYLF